MSPIMTGTEVFKRTAVYEREAPGIRLHAPQWKLLLAFDGQRSLAEVALSASIPFSEALGQTETFLKNEWIAEQPITLEEYLKRATASGNFSGGIIPPSVVLHEPKPETSRLATKPENGASTAASREIPETLVDNTPSARGPMRLSAIVDYIISLAETIPLGQLLAYRIFLRVPPEILQSEEIVSIHLVDDNSIIRSTGLQKAIADAVHEITKRTLPDSVYATA
jgi:hypothetical protein